MLQNYSNKGLNPASNKQIKLNKAVKDYKKEDTLFLAVDSKNKPTDIFWRRRLDDGDFEFIEKQEVS